MIRKPLAVALALAAFPALAETPRVVTDIAPVHALVSMVMGDLGTPDMIVTPGASPHTYALRPSQARDLQQADLVVWIGPELTPWLGKPLETLPNGANKLALLQVKGTELLAFRDHFAEEEHEDHGEEDHADHMTGNGDHDEHDHDDHAEHDHAEHDHAEHGHHHEGTDPHAWLDPVNAQVWLGEIAAQLSALDPEHGETYAANAESARARLQSLTDDLTAQLSGLDQLEFVTLHDAFQYFEHRFDIHGAGAVSLGDAAEPTPARLKKFRDKVTSGGLSCAFAEPEFDTRLLDAMLDGQGIEIKVLDALGSDKQPGAALYTQMLQQMGDTIASCVQK